MQRLRQGGRALPAGLLQRGEHRERREPGADADVVEHPAVQAAQLAEQEHELAGDPVDLAHADTLRGGAAR